MSELPTVILMTSNGVGMGHLSRQLTIALSGRQRFRAVIFSLSAALPRLIQAAAAGDLPEGAERGIRYEYCPSRESGWLPPGGWKSVLRRRYKSYRWHPYLRDRLLALVAETEARALVFDGVFPYEGLLHARASFPALPFIWMRRGMWQRDAPAARFDYQRHFDLVLEPGDYASEADTGPTSGRSHAKVLAPISLTDVLAPASREDARTALRLPPDRPVMLLAPGSGALGSVEASATAVERTVRARAPEWVLAVTRQGIARHTIDEDHPAVVVLDDVYPLARYLSAFDAAVSAAGYNSVHELLSARIPTLLVPSTNHATDDQRARAAGVMSRGAALTTDHSALDDHVARLLDPRVRSELGNSCRALERASGGTQAASAVAALADLTGSIDYTVRRSAPTSPRPDARTHARHGSPSGILFSKEVSPTDVRGKRPVEHLMADSSVGYRHAREQIANWLYRTD